MPLQVLNDEELRSRVCEARSFIAGLMRECEARHWLIEGALLGNAEVTCAEVSLLLLKRSLPAWQFVNSEGKVFECSWCNVELQRQPDPEASHGCCPRHHQEQLAELKRRRSQTSATPVAA